MVWSSQTGYRRLIPDSVYAASCTPSYSNMLGLRSTRSAKPKFAHQHINKCCGICGLRILHILSLHTSIFKSSSGLGTRPSPNREVGTPPKLNMLALRATHLPDSEVCTPADSNMLGLRSTHYPEIPSLHTSILKHAGACGLRILQTGS